MRAAGALDRALGSPPAAGRPGAMVAAGRPRRCVRAPARRDVPGWPVFVSRSARAVIGRLATPAGPSSRAGGRRLASAALLLLLGPLFLVTAGCARPDQPRRFAAVVLIAGSDEQAVFDNARRDFAERLRETSPVPLVTAMLSARPGAAEDGVFPATLANIDAAFARTAPQASACLLFATSHGVPHGGLVLARERELLTPAYLDRVLGRHCAGKPTIAIVSGCFSGMFADAPMPSDDRIVLTAASRDRPSFGCSNDLTYTYFDDALLRLLPGASTWDGLYEDLKAAVAAKERALDAPPSRPQASFGAAVRRGELLDG